MEIVQKVPIRHVTDGDLLHRPNDSAWMPVTPTLYLRKLAVLWLQDRGEAIDHGEHSTKARNVQQVLLTLSGEVTYELDRLPDGYVLFERRRPNNPKIIDRHLYGNPRRKFFDSPNRFWPHFKHLMDDYDVSDCPCTICGGGGLRRPNRSKMLDGSRQEKTSLASQPAPSAALDLERVPDVLRSLLSRLRLSASLDVEYEEPMSMDWQCERRSLPGALEKLPSMPAFLPRCGEIVLYVRDIKPHNEICKDEKSSEFKLFDNSRKTFVGHPRWEAGIVTQESAEKVRSFDILMETHTKTSITHSGFRIEPLRKARAASDYCYIPLHLIRPFIFWEQMLNGIPQSHYHESIERAMTAMASFSLVGKFRFAGKWPKAALAAKGIYLGSELYTVGDAVWLKDVNEGESHSISEALVISHITLEFKFTGSSSDLSQCESSIYIYGKVLTSKQSHAAPGFPHPLSKSEVSGLSKGLLGHRLFNRYSPSQTCRVDLHRVLGRCYDADTMLMWFPVLGSEQGLPFDYGLYGIRKARRRARDMDQRIRRGLKFFWGNSRGEALGIHSVNGIPLADYDLDRDEDKLEEWTEALRLLSRRQKPIAEKSAALMPKGSSIQMGKSAEAFPVVEVASLDRALGDMVRDADESDEGSSDMRMRFGLRTALKRDISMTEDGSNSCGDAAATGAGFLKQPRTDVSEW